MIISRTPFRVSFLGGGTDLPSFFEEEEGAVLSTTIDKYMYITINDRFDETFRLAYSKTEICKSIDEIDHKIFRYVLSQNADAIRDKNQGRGLELLSMADIPGGTGLGSSSTFTVGLLHAMKAHLGVFQSAEQLAAEASRIEIEELGEPIGKQDQYAAAYGGLQFFRFHPSGQVSADPVICSQKSKNELEASMMLFYTGQTRSASKVLSEQKSNAQKNRENLREMAKLAYQAKASLEQGRPIKNFAEILHQGWELKRTLAAGISASEIDLQYERARKAGALGGKILGAGGGGFLLMLCPPELQSRVREELKELRQVPIAFESWGSKIIFVGHH